MSFPFPAPTWAGAASISGRQITRISGDAFADGYPSGGIFFLFDPAVLDGIVNVPPYFIDDGGQAFYQFATWFVDSDHLALTLDATYDLLIPAGTVGNYAPAVTIGGHSLAAYKWPSFSRATCWADGSDITSDPSSDIRSASPGVSFGGDAFDSATSDLVGHPQIYIGGTEFTVGSVDSSTEIAITGSAGGVVVVIWMEWNVPPPPTGSPSVLAVLPYAILWTGQTDGRRRSGFSMRPGEQRQFHVQVRGDTSIDTSVTWACSVGSIDTSGLYTAPTPFAGFYQTVIVTATSNQDGTSSGTVCFQLAP